MRQGEAENTAFPCAAYTSATACSLSVEGVFGVFGVWISGGGRGSILNSAGQALRSAASECSGSRVANAHSDGLEFRPPKR